MVIADAIDRLVEDCVYVNGMFGCSFQAAGIAAARVSSECTLTDLPQFVPNLRYNIQMNADFIECGSMCTTSAQPLDWLCEDEAIDTSPRCLAGHRQPHIIIGADVGTCMRLS